MSPRTEQQNKEIRQKTQLMIIEAALKLFAEEGYAGASMQSIARGARVSKGNLYNYFTSKQELLEGVLMHGLEQFEAFYHNTSDTLLTEEEFAFAVKKNFEVIRANKVFWKLYYNLFGQPKVQWLFSKILEPFLEQYIAVFESYYKNKGEVDPKAAALLLASALDGVSLGYLMMGETYPLDAVTEQLINKFK